MSAKRRVVRSLLLLTLVVAAGCSGSGSSTASKPLPTVGQCHRLPSDNIHDVLETGRVVSCTTPHTLETASVVALPGIPSQEQLTSYNTQCSQVGRSYVGLTGQPPTTFLQVLLTPPKSESQQWVRCDVGLAATTNGQSFAVLTSSLKSAAMRKLASVLPCLNVVPDSAKAQPYVPCTAPHLAQTASTYATTPTRGTYPDAKVLAQRGQSTCRALISTRPDARQLSVYVAWGSQANWTQAGGGDLRGVCWYYRTDHTLLPALH